MIVRSASLFLFSCAALTLTSCQNMANPLGGATRMFQAMGRSVGVVSDASKIDALRLDASEVECAREAASQREALPEHAPESPSGSSENRFAFAR